MSIETPDNPAAPPAGKKKEKPAGKNGVGLMPLTAAMKAVTKGDLSVRAETDRLEGENVELAALLNSMLDSVEAKVKEGEARKAQTVQVVDQALDALIALVRQGELSPALRATVSRAGGMS